MNEDVLLAVYIEDVFSDTVPNKTSGYIFDNQKSSCTNDATIRWDNSSWAPIITGMDTFKTTCNLYFKEPNFIKNCAVETCDVSYEEKKSSIKTIVFQNEITTMDNAVVSVDLSEKEDESIVAHLVENGDDPGTYNAYIQSNETIYLPTNSAIFFSYYAETVDGDYISKLTSIEGLEFVDTSQVTNMSRMFYDLRYLSSLDLSHFDTSNVTDMAGMFANNAVVDNASILLELDLSSFDTSKVTNMSNMFSGQRNIVRLDVSSFDTSNVTNMSYMFGYMNDLISLDLKHFNTSKVTNMSNMFTQIKKISSLDLSSFDTSNVTNMYYMFGLSTGLTELNITSFDTSQVTNMGYIFYGLDVEKLDLSHFDTSNVTNMGGMFRDTSIQELNLSSFDTTKVTIFSQFFWGSSDLTNVIYGEKFVYKNNANVSSMFSSCPANKPTDVSWEGIV